MSRYFLLAPGSSQRASERRPLANETRARRPPEETRALTAALAEFEAVASALEEAGNPGLPAAHGS